MDAISRVRYNGSYTIAAKPIKTLKLRYTMNQILIMVNSARFSCFKTGKSVTCFVVILDGSDFTVSP